MLVFKQAYITGCEVGWQTAPKHDQSPPFVCLAYGMQQSGWSWGGGEGFAMDGEAGQSIGS